MKEKTLEKDCKKYEKKKTLEKDCKKYEKKIH
jgi:hypothetical protein